MGNKIEFKIEVDDSGVAKITKVTGTQNELTDAMKKQDAAARGLTGSWDKLVKAAAGYFALSQLKSFISDTTRLAGVQQEAVAGMEQALKSMGRYTPELSAGLQQTAASLQEVTTFGDESTIAGQKFLVTYKGITDDLLPRTTEVMLDLAALMGGDTVQAANMLGKASMGMTGELRRVGITIDDATFKAKGFVGALDEVSQQVGGQARAKALTGIGPWKQLANIWGDSKEAVGELTLSLSTGLLPTLKEFAKIVKQAAEYWKQLFAPPDAKGALEQQRIKISEQIQAEERLLSYLKNTPAGRISAGPDGVSQVEARIAALKASMQTVSRSLITMSAEKPAAPKGGGSDDQKSPYDDKWLSGYLAAVDKAWKAEVEHSEGLGELAVVNQKIRDDDVEKQKKAAEKAAEDEKKLLQTRMDAYRQIADTLEKFGVDTHEFRLALIERETEAFMEALQGQADAEELVNGYRMAKMRELAEERFTQEHEVMDALRESWGLTWEEIRGTSSIVWNEVGDAVSGLTQTIGNMFMSVVTGSMTAKKAATDLLKIVGAKTVEMLISIGVQKLILAAIGKATLATETAAIIFANKAITASATPAAIMESIASYGGAAEAGAASFISAVGIMQGVAAAMNTVLPVVGGGPGAGGSPSYGKGGIVIRPTLAWVGEEGDPEAIIPLGSRRRNEAMGLLAKIMPGLGMGGTEDARPGLGGGGSMTVRDVRVDVRFYGDNKFDTDMDTVRKQIGRSVEDALRGA